MTPLTYNSSLSPPTCPPSPFNLNLPPSLFPQTSPLTNLPEPDFQIENQSLWTTLESKTIDQIQTLLQSTDINVLPSSPTYQSSTSSSSQVYISSDPYTQGPTTIPTSSSNGAHNSRPANEPTDLEL